ncbi:unnamed protein product [Rotaria socialis]|uniref:DEP domain-containing protein n=1 Tax=Rotaria socialis TaxID=392032 RepID=A0A820BDH9_9BILA|nr:unnamed protein product [Rotaria socialis]CAF3407942.1 unnamed protein product [Rotaria socialis]CAF3641050.1 unnamed protein product [Rotaria socialis]CAF4089490.1 unnamed protein product [Rotaria socialis]CAF4190913.1 unnamed protein product [Rotaria socialis]
MCQRTTIKSSEDRETIKMSPNDYTMTTNNHPNHSDRINDRTLSIENNSNTKYFVDLYTAALHLRQRMREENLIHRSYSAYLNDKNSQRSLFHNCFHSYEAIDWLIKKQLCKTIYDGVEIFQVLEKLKVIHHVCDLNEFEYPSSGSSSISNVKYLYRFRLDDGTADSNRSFQQFASIYETYTSLFTLDKSQCRGVNLQQQVPLTDPYSEQPGVVLKGDNLARMLALRSGVNMQNVERLADDMIMYGLVKFDECDQQTECCCSSNKFHDDSNHQYILSNTHRLLADKRLDLIALMQSDALLLSSPIHHSPPLIGIPSNSLVSVSCPDRSPSIDHMQTKNSLNRTLSSYYCNDHLNKLSPLLPSSNCCHHYYSRMLPSNETIHLSSLIQSTNIRRHPISGLTSSNSSLISDEPQMNRRISNGDELDCTTKLTCTVANSEVFRRKKSASLNSPANSESRPTVDELERLELPWCWKSYSLKRDRRGYGLILHGDGPCYIERLDPYGSAYTSGIRINEYIYAIEGVNVLRRSGKEVERLLSMFDKCTIYTVYNRDDFSQHSIPPNEYHSNKIYPLKQPSSLSSSLNDYNNNANTLLTTLNNHSSNQQVTLYSSSPQNQQNSSPSSSVDGASSCSISPKQFVTTNKKGTLSKHFNLFKLNSRSCSNSSSINTIK